MATQDVRLAVDLDKCNEESSFVSLLRCVTARAPLSPSNRSSRDDETVLLLFSEDIRFTSQVHLFFSEVLFTSVQAAVIMYDCLYNYSVLPGPRYSLKLRKRLCVFGTSKTIITRSFSFTALYKMSESYNILFTHLKYKDILCTYLRSQVLSRDYFF